MAERIRPKAVCVCRRDQSILVGGGYDAAKGETFYCPPGGGVEFGERAADAVRRELREELEAEVCDLVLLGVLENIFTSEGRPGHEIVFIFAARFADATLYERDELPGLDGAQHFVARWMPLARFGPDGLPLYPDDLYELLRATAD